MKDSTLLLVCLMSFICGLVLIGKEMSNQGCVNALKTPETRLNELEKLKDRCEALNKIQT